MAPRIAPLEPPYRSKVQDSFDRVMQGADPLLLFRTLAVSERAWGRFRAGSLLDPGPLTLRQREILIDRTCALAGCGYEWGVHVKIFARHAGLTPEQIAATAGEGSRAGCWSEEERVLLEAAEALHARATLSEGEWSRLRAAFDEAQVLEILLLCGFYRTVAYVANGLALPPEPGCPTLPQAA